jgi:hypothetical protein
MNNFCLSGAALLAEISLSGISPAVALAAVAVVGYLVGRQAQRSAEAAKTATRRELRRTLDSVAELESITDSVLRATRDASAQCRQSRDRIERALSA